MKKKLCILLLIVSISILFSSCSLNFNKNKPYNYYYTNELCKDISLYGKYNSTIMDTNYYRKIVLDKDAMYAVNEFFKSLDTKYFIAKPKDLPSSPKYKLYFKFKKSSYVINVYNDKYISVFPWDGKYPMDYIDISKIPATYNLCGICEYIFNKVSERK